METEQAMVKVKTEERRNPMFVAVEELLERARVFSEDVAARAYRFFEERGSELGHDLEDWIRAEFELSRGVVVELRHAPDTVTMRAEVPGFTERDIRLSVEPRRILLSGKSVDSTKVEEDGALVSEIRHNDFCRDLTLPVEVDPETAVATLKDGILEVHIKRVPLVEPVTVEINAS